MSSIVFHCTEKMDNVHKFRAGLKIVFEFGLEFETRMSSIENVAGHRQ